jgi:hypothetical protein
MKKILLIAVSLLASGGLSLAANTAVKHARPQSYRHARPQSYQQTQTASALLNDQKKHNLGGTLAQPQPSNTVSRYPALDCSTDCNDPRRTERDYSACEKKCPVDCPICGY